MKRISMVIAMALLTGCIAHLNTRSGGPEVTIHGVSMAKAKGAFENYLADHGFAIDRTEGASLWASKDASQVNQVLFGRPGVWVRSAMHLNFLRDEQGNVRVTYHGFVGNNEVYGDWRQVQYQMECIAADLEQRPRPEAPPPAPPARSPKGQ